MGKEILQSVREWRADQEQSRARLHQLQALLHASHIAFDVQNERAQRLAQRLRSHHADELVDEPGFERLFTAFYDRFDPDERDLHDVVRAYTEHGLRPLNAAMLTWLRNDVEHRTIRGKTGDERELSALLNRLDAHLLLWLAKYEAWIPTRPDHALVYMADEEDHGLDFPKGIEATLAKVLSRL